MNPLDLQEALVRARQEARQGRYSAFEPELLAWLALLPEWTDQLAVALGLGNPKQVGALVARLGEAELIEQRVFADPDGRQGLAFWLLPAERAGLAEYLRTSTGLDAAGALTRLARELDRLPEADSPWRQPLLDVSREYRPDPSGLRLVSALRVLIAAGQLEQASRLVTAVQAAGELLGGTLAEAAERAQWRLQRAQRDEQDRRDLRHYIGRAPVEDAIEALLNDHEQWALHLMGAGGAGKTMVLRYLLSGKFAADRGLPPLAVARIDFDYIDTTYPERRPAELLLSFAEELLGYGETRDFAARYRNFQASAIRLHEETHRPDDTTGSEDGVVAELTRQVVYEFGRLLGELPNRVVLVLDTCEELSKLYAPNASAPGIDHMFQILEFLHEVLPSTRVVLSGRRNLTPAADPGPAAAGPRLRPRPYLRVLPMSGFTRLEADQYIDLRVPDIASAVRATLMDQVRDPGGWYNPFELTLYCEWVLGEPDLDPGLLRQASGDAYIEQRILGRLGDEVRQALPIAVAFGSFTPALMGPALERLGLDPEGAFDGLAAQEWVIVHAKDASGCPTLVEIDAQVRRRLAAVVNAREHVDVVQLGADAVALADRTPLAELASEVVEAAVRLSPPPQAAALWLRIERRVVQERAWDRVAAVVAGAGAAVADRAGSEDQTILAAVLATQASIRLHADPHGEQGAIWRSVADVLARYPDVAKPMLAGRAAAGLLRAGEQADLDDLAAAPDDAVLAAAEALQARDEPLPPALAERLSRTDPAAPADLMAARQLALAWHYLSGGRDNAAVVAIHVALAALRRAPVTPGPHADWIPPADLGHRCLLAELVVAAASGQEPALVTSPGELRQALDSVSGIDGERLASLAIDLLARHGPVDPESLIAAEAADRYVPSRLPDSWVHRMTRPLTVAIAEAWSVHGEPERAARLLRERIDLAITTVGDVVTVDACQLALLRLCRRYRTTRFADSVHRLAEEGSRAVRAEAWLVRTLVRGERPPDPVRAGSYYGWWRCLDATAGLPVSPGPIREPGVPPAGGAGNAREFEKLAGREVRSALPDEPGLRVLPETLADVLRFHAVLSPELRGRYPGLPAFLFGRAALEAGEVLALHLPAEGATLLRAAAEELGACGDPLGAAQAGVLATLAARRSGAPATAAIAGSREADLLDGPEWGWAARLQAAGSDLAEPGQASPEFPGPAPTDPGSDRRHLPWYAVAARWARVVFRRNPYGASATVTVTAADGGAAVSVVEHAGVAELDPGARGPARGLRPVGFVDPAGGPPARLDLGGHQDARRRTLVQLEIDREVEQYPWERLLDFAIDGERPAAVLPFRREPGTWRRFSRLAWLRRASYRQRCVVRVVGTPVEAYGGIRVRIPGGDADRLGVASLVSSLPAVVILQAEPADGPPRPLGELRAGFLRLARSALDGGANAVLVIPPLSDPLAEQAGALADRSLRRRLAPPRPRRLLPLLAELRQLTGAAEGGQDAALDVLLLLHTHD